MGYSYTGATGIEVATLMKRVKAMLNRNDLHYILTSASSMSRLKNLLMSEGVSEISARRKIADLETEAGCLVVESYGRLKLNQELLSQMLLQ